MEVSGLQCSSTPFFTVWYADLKVYLNLLLHVQKRAIARTTVLESTAYGTFALYPIYVGASHFHVIYLLSKLVWHSCSRCHDAPGPSLLINTHNPVYVPLLL